MIEQHNLKFEKYKIIFLKSRSPKKSKGHANFAQFFFIQF
jgi:hypothetical protein